MREAIEELKGLRAGHVRLVAGLGTGVYLLPPVIARFQRAFPGMHVELIVEGAAEVFERVQHGGAELGITLGYETPTTLVVRPLYRDALVLVVGRGHPWARRGARPLPADALAHQSLVLLGGPYARSRRLLAEALSQARIAPHVELEFDNPEAVKRVVATGEGAAFLFHSNVAAEVAAGVLQVVPVAGLDLHGDFVAVWRQRQYLSPLVQTFLDFAASTIALQFQDIALARPVTRELRRGHRSAMSPPGRRAASSTVARSDGR